jgi:hypothetical protein
MAMKLSIDPLGGKIHKESLFFTASFHFCGLYDPNSGPQRVKAFKQMVIK